MSHFSIENVFVNKHPEYYRIPVVAVTGGHLLAFSNRRLYTASDDAKASQLVCRRLPAIDKNQTDIRPIFAAEGWNVPIGSAIVDSNRNCVRLFYHRWISKNRSNGI